MKIAHNRKWRSATSLVEGLHYFLPYFLKKSKQFITTRRGEKKMPQNKRESLIYTFIMCFMMVFWMSIYNISLHMGGLSMESDQSRMVRVPDRIYFCNVLRLVLCILRSQKDLHLNILLKPDKHLF